MDGKLTRRLPYNGNMMEKKDKETTLHLLHIYIYVVIRVKCVMKQT